MDEEEVSEWTTTITAEGMAAAKEFADAAGAVLAPLGDSLRVFSRIVSENVAALRRAQATLERMRDPRFEFERRYAKQRAGVRRRVKRGHS